MCCHDGNDLKKVDGVQFHDTSAPFGFRTAEFSMTEKSEDARMKTIDRDYHEINHDSPKNPPASTGARDVYFHHSIDPGNTQRRLSRKTAKPSTAKIPDSSTNGNKFSLNLWSVGVMMLFMKRSDKKKDFKPSDGFEWDVAGLSFERSAKHCLQVCHVEKGSIADIAGCQEGDILLKVADQDVSSVLPSAVMAMIDLRLRGGQSKVSISIVREQGDKFTSHIIWLKNLKARLSKTSHDENPSMDINDIMEQIDDKIQSIEDRHSSRQV